MANNHKNGESEHTQYMPIGMCIGIGVGTAIGAACGNMAIGMCMGLSIGMCVGLAIDAMRKKKVEDAPEAEEADKEEEK